MTPQRTKSLTEHSDFNQNSRFTSANSRGMLINGNTSYIGEVPGLLDTDDKPFKTKMT